MGLLTSRVLAKVASLPLKGEARQALIKKIVQSKNNYQVKTKLYAWDISGGVAKEVFFSEKEAITDWCVHANVWAKKESLPEVSFYFWEMPIKDLLGHVRDKKIVDISLKGLEVSTKSSTLPQELLKDIQQNPGKPV